MRLVLASLALLATGCGGMKNPEQVNLPSDSAVRPDPPAQSIFVRASFDDDPGSYVGRFVPEGLPTAEIDENRAAQTRCSQFITTKEVRASGTFDETFNASTSVSGSLGIKPIGSVGGGFEGGNGVRVHYKLAKKLRAEVSDPAAFDQCCKKAPDQCSGTFIGEFLYGTGAVYKFAGQEAALKADGTYKKIDASVDFKDGFAWKRVSEFEDVYFAFRTQAANLGSSVAAGGPDDCAWASSVPTSLDGEYFVGMSMPVASEAQARDKAIDNAKRQVVKYLGEYITSAVQSTTNAIEGYLDDQEVVTHAAEGIASRVKAERWCAAETVDTPKGTMYVVKVLAFFPKAEEKEAARVVMQRMTEKLQAQGKLTAQDEATLEETGRKLEQ